MSGEWEVIYKTICIYKSIMVQVNILINFVASILLSGKYPIALCVSLTFICYDDIEEEDNSKL